MNLTPRHRYILLAVFGYLALALTWIFISDQLLSTHADVESMLWLSTAKGIFFVLISATIFYFVLRSVPAQTDPHATPSGEALIDSLTTGLWPRWLNYLFAVALVGIAFIVRVNLPGALANRPLLIIYVLPIILAALLGGFGPGLVATCLSGLAGWYVLPPSGTFLLPASHDLFQWGLLVVSGLTLSLTSEAMRRARNRERLRAQQCDLANTTLQESKARYRELFQANPLPMWIYDLETLRFLAVNDAAVAHYGYSREEFLSMTIRDIRPAEDVPGLLTHLKQGKDGLNTAGIWRHRGKDGSLIDVEISTHTMMHNDRRTKMVLANDITERKRAETELREKELQYRNLADAGLALIWTAGTDKLCTYFNRRWLEFTGRALEQELGNGWTEGVHPDDFDRCLDVYVTAFDRRQPFEMEYRLRHADGDYRWIRDMGTPNYNSTGEFVGYIGHCFDITEQKIAELERQRLINELGKRNAELECFTYTVSHDLKSPLVTILGFIGQLEQDLADNDRESVAADLGFIDGAANQMRELLDSLLQLSRAGRSVGDPHPIDLAALAREAIELLGDRLAHARLRIDFPAELPIVKGDPVRLLEVFQNLLENAAKFTAGHPAPCIEVGCTTGTDALLCHVRDNGIGIPAEYQEKVFGLFEQLDPGSGGTGIGLAIVRRIVEEHGGRIWVESAGPGTGCTFWFTLPTSATVA